MGATITFGQYMLYLLNPGKMILMLLMALVCIAAAIGIILLATKTMSKKYSDETRQDFMRDETISLTERFYELIFSTTFILLFVAIYFAIDYFGFGTTDKSIWSKYNGIILLFFILGSVILNSFVDNKIIPLNHIRPGERGAMRLLGMIYMLIIFAYIKFFYVDSNYDNIIMYFITLVIGRFVYFDASLESFQEAMQGVRDNLPLLLLALMCTAIMSAVGFNTGYLQEQYGVVFNLFYAHLFLLVVIFIVHRTEIATKFFEKPKQQAQQPTDTTYQDAASSNRQGIAYPGQETMWLNAKEINERDREIRFEKAKEAERLRRERRRTRLDDAVRKTAERPMPQKPQKRDSIPEAEREKLREETFDPWEKTQETAEQPQKTEPPKRYVSHRPHGTHTRHYKG